MGRVNLDNIEIKSKALGIGSFNYDWIIAVGNFSKRLNGDGRINLYSDTENISIITLNNKIEPINHLKSIAIYCNTVVCFKVSNSTKYDYEITVLIKNKNVIKKISLIEHNKIVDAQILTQFRSDGYNYHNFNSVIYLQTINGKFLLSNNCRLVDLDNRINCAISNSEYIFLYKSFLPINNPIARIDFELAYFITGESKLEPVVRQI